MSSEVFIFTCKITCHHNSEAWNLDMKVMSLLEIALIPLVPSEHSNKDVNLPTVWDEVYSSHSSSLLSGVRFQKHSNVSYCIVGASLVREAYIKNNTLQLLCTHFSKMYSDGNVSST
jgi:hypothetical protein